MSVRVALAFESGGDSRACAEALSVLAAADAQTTIFLDGRWAEREPDLVRRAADAGHELANHAYSHPDLRTLSDDQIADELERTEAIAMQLTGRSTQPWLRPPFQQVDDRVRRVAGDHGFRCLCRDALDGAHYLGPSTPETILRRSVERAVDGAVLTYHLHSQATASVLRAIIDRLRQGGATIVPVSALPTPPAERSPLHPDFAALLVDCGYLRMHQAASPPQMVNLLAVGADLQAMIDEPMVIGQTGSRRASLFVFNGRQPMRLESTAGEHQIACLAGEVSLEADDIGGRRLASVVLRTGDCLSLGAGWVVQLLPAPSSARAILLMIK